MSNMEYIIVSNYLFIQLIEIDDFIDCDFGLRFMIIKMFSQPIVSVMKFVKWKQICDCDVLVDVRFCQRENNVLSYF